jgi:hypothetical protein
MAPSEASLEGRARRAYEWGRAGWAARRGLVVALLAASAFCAGPSLAATASCIAVLTLLVTAFLWRGQEFAVGVRMGLLAGLVPFLLPMVAQAGGGICLPAWCPLLPTACVAGGVIGGVVLGLQGRRPLANPTHFWIAAVLVAAALGSVGCLLAGLAGLAGLATGLLVGAAPVLAARTA